MIPEAFDSGSIDLFRCIEFPKKWAYQATLLKGKFVDTSVWQHGGLWWMMTTVPIRTRGPHVYYSFMRKPSIVIGISILTTLSH